MTFKEHTEVCVALLKENPELGDLPIVSSSDEEGNSFGLVFYQPTAGQFTGDYFNPTKKPHTAVCIN